MEHIKRFVRSSRFIGTLIAIAVIAVISIGYFYPDAIQGNVLRQHDMQQGMANGHEAEAFREATGEDTRWTNALFSGMPTFQIAPSYPSDSLISWVNSVMGLGLPDPANLVAMMAIGFFILLMSMKMRWYVALIGAVAYAFSSYFIIIIGAGHIWKFVTLTYVPPTIAGVILCYRGRYLAGAALAAFFAMMQIASNHPQMTYYFGFVIALIALAYLVHAIRKHLMTRWLKATAALAFAGVLAVCANLPTLYNTYEYSKQTMRGGHSELASAGSGEQTTSGLDRDYITQYSYGASETFSLLIPDVKGGASIKPEKGTNRMLNLSDLPKAKEMIAKGEIPQQEAQYLEYMSQYFGEPEGTNGPVYVGALIVAMFILGCAIVRGPLKWALLAATVLSLFLALGRNCMWLTNIFIDYVPLYNKFRTVESILVIAEFTMPLLAVMALQKLITTPDAWSRYRRPILWSFGVVLFFCLIGIIAPGFYGSAISEGDRQIDSYITQSLAAQGYPSSVTQMFSLSNPTIYKAVESLRESMVTADSLRSFLFVAAGFLVLLLFFRKKTGVAVTITLVGLLIAGDLLTVNKRYLDSDSFLPRQLTMGNPFPMSDADRQILSDTTSHYRVMDIPRFTQAAPSYYHKTIGGYHAAKLTRYQDIISRHLNNFLSGNPSDADFEVLNMLNARYVIASNEEVVLNDDAYGNAWLVDSIVYTQTPDDEMGALSALGLDTVAVADIRFEPQLRGHVELTEGDTIFLTSYAPNRLTYHAQTDKGAIAVFSEVYFPWGWNATVDGTPVELSRVDYILRAMRLDPGNHTIEMTFNPASLRNTSTVAYISIVVIYLLMLLAIAGAVARIAMGKNEPADDK